MQCVTLNIYRSSSARYLRGHRTAHTTRYLRGHRSARYARCAHRAND